MKRYLFILLAGLTMGGCSLFKFTMDTGDVPLTSQQVSMRTLTRAFYRDFSSSVVAAADSIYNSTDSAELKIRAINWKINSTSLCAEAAFGSVPEVSLLNTWILCRSMDRYMKAAPDSALFGRFSGIARECTGKTEQKIEDIAAKTLPKDRFDKMKEFVAQNSDPDNPAAREDMMLKWIAYLGVPDSTYIKTAGSIGQTVNDLSEKMSGYSVQWSSEISWSKDLLTTHLGADGTAKDLRTRLDTLQMQFGRMATVLENTPDIAAGILDELNAQANQLIRTIDISVSTAFVDVDRQRGELQAFIDSQRVYLMAQADSTARHTVQTTLDALPSMVGRLMIYAVAAFVVLFSIPFVLGMLIGTYRERRRSRKKTEENEESGTQNESSNQK